MAEEKIVVAGVEVGVWYYDCDGPINDPSLNIAVAFDGTLEVGKGVAGTLGKLAKLIDPAKDSEISDAIKTYVPTGSVTLKIYFGTIPITTPCHGDPANARRLAYEFVLYVSLQVSGTLGGAKGSGRVELKFVLARGSHMCTCPTPTHAYIVPGTGNAYVALGPGSDVGEMLASIAKADPSGCPPTVASRDQSSPCSSSSTQSSPHAKPCLDEVASDVHNIGVMLKSLETKLGKVSS